MPKLWFLTAWKSSVGSTLTVLSAYRDLHIGHLSLNKIRSFKNISRYPRKHSFCWNLENNGFLALSKSQLSVLDWYFVTGTSEPPTDLKVDKVTNDSVKLSWREPTFTGNCPIQKYIVEKRGKGDQGWTKCGESKEPVCNIDDLEVSSAHLAVFSQPFYRKTELFSHPPTHTYDKH